MTKEQTVKLLTACILCLGIITAIVTIIQYLLN